MHGATMRIDIHRYLPFKSCILMSDDGPYVPKYVAFIDYIMKSSWCVKMSQHDRKDPLKKYS